MSKRFPHFDKHVCPGDSVTYYDRKSGITFTATVVRDETPDRPDERQDGFWPSLDPNSAGYIGDRSQKALRRAQARAQAVMDAWRRDEWWYCGVCVVASKADVQLTHRYSNALWGIEANYPGGRGRPNSYLRQVANELLPETRDEAFVVLDKLAA